MVGVYSGTSQIKCAYIGTTAVKCIYVGTTKVRPTLPAGPYYVNALVVGAGGPGGPLSDIKVNGYYVAGGGGGGAVCCYSSLQINATASVTVGTSPAPSTSQVRGGNSCLVAKNGTCIACGGTNFTCCGTTTVHKRLHGGASGSGCPGGADIEYYSGRRVAGSGGGGAGGCGCSAIYGGKCSACGGNGGAGLCGYGGGGAGGGSHGNGTATCGGGQVNAKATNYGGGGGGAQLSSCPSGFAGCCGCQGVVKICYLTTGACGFCTATGGTITTIGCYKVHTFTSSGTFTITG